MDDKQILDLYWARSENAIQETADKYGRYCHFIAFHILNNVEDSEDCVNDTYLRAWKTIPPKRPERLSVFLGKLTRNLSLDRYRRNTAAKRGFGQVDEKYIEEAAPVTRQHKKKNGWVKWGVTAACLAFAVYAGTRLIPLEAPGDGPEQPSSVYESQQAEPDEPSTSAGNPNSEAELPMLTIAQLTNEGMGFEGYMAHDISELVNGNPWNESVELSALPVYANQLEYDSRFIVRGDREAMKKMLEDLMVQFGLDVNETEITDNAPDAQEQEMIREKLKEVGEDFTEDYAEPTEVIAEGNGIRITVDNEMTALIYFEPAVPLPDEYNYTFYSSYEDMAAVAEYLREEYKGKLGMENAKLAICGGDYDIYSRQSYRIGMYSEGETVTDRIVRYNFKQAVFYCDDAGDLSMIRIYNPDLSEKTGEYPVISVQEAKELLLNGNYITTVPYEMPGKEYIARVELVYRKGTYETYYMPYYRFYVEVPYEERENGLKTYGAYYVPAVEGKYLTEMPVWDGSFN